MIFFRILAVILHSSLLYLSPWFLIRSSLSHLLIRSFTLCSCPLYCSLNPYPDNGLIFLSWFLRALQGMYLHLKIWNKEPPMRLNMWHSSYWVWVHLTQCDIFWFHPFASKVYVLIFFLEPISVPPCHHLMGIWGRLHFLAIVNRAETNNVVICGVVLR